MSGGVSAFVLVFRGMLVDKFSFDCGIFEMKVCGCLVLGDGVFEMVCFVGLSGKCCGYWCRLGMGMVDYCVWQIRNKDYS